MTETKEFNGFPSQSAYDKAFSIAKEAMQYFPQAAAKTLSVYGKDINTDNLEFATEGDIDIWIGDYQFSITFWPFGSNTIHVSRYYKGGDDELLLSGTDSEFSFKVRDIPMSVLSAAFFLITEQQLNIDLINNS